MAGRDSVAARALVALTLVVAMVAWATPAQARTARKPSHGQVADPTLARARAAYAALQTMYIPQYGLYQGDPSRDQAYSFVWPFSQALAATVSMASLPGAVGRSYGKDVGARVYDGLARYWDPSKSPPAYDGGVVAPLGDGGTIGYDDNEWIGLELVRRYRAVHNAALLQRAQQLFALAVSGWDRNPSHACPGGVVFSQDPSNVDRNAVTNAPGAELGVRLYLITHNRNYLHWALNFYNWVIGCLLGPGGFYEDHLDFTGKRDATIWSYNEGTMIGATALLYQATGKRHFLRSALRAGRAAAAYYNHTRLAYEPPYFVAIFLDNLELLSQVTRFPQYRPLAQWYGDWAWNQVREPASDLFPFYTDAGQLIEQAAMVRVYATLAGAKQ